MSATKKRTVKVRVLKLSQILSKLLVTRPYSTMDMPSDPPIVLTHDAERPDASIDVAHSLEYWNSVSADVNGMLGGFPQTSRIDLQGSSNFLTKLRRGRAQAASKDPLPPLQRVADCGAGIGRITKGLLLPVSDRVDVIEPVKKFTDELVQSLANEEHKQGQSQLGDIINLGLQDWIPEPGSYDVIWNQWCLGHLTDAQLIVYLQRCKQGLKPATQDDGTTRSWIVVKENMSTDIKHKDIYDDEDSSVTRSDAKFRVLFQQAGLKIIATEQQRGMPKELFPVRMYALRPE
jgi:protein N-terminal methyltransferase